MRTSIFLAMLMTGLPLGVVAQQAGDETAPEQGAGATNTNESVYFWVDEDGVEHYSDSPVEAPPGAEEMDLDTVDRLSVGGEGLREDEEEYLQRQVRESIAGEKAAAEAEPDTIVVDAESRPQPVVVGDDGFAPADPDADPDELVDRDGVAIGPAGDNIDDLQDTVTSGTFPDDIGTSDDLEPNVESETDVGISNSLGGDIDSQGGDGADTGGVSTGNSLGTSAAGS